MATWAKTEEADQFFGTSLNKEKKGDHSHVLQVGAREDIAGQ